MDEVNQPVTTGTKCTIVEVKLRCARCGEELNGTGPTPSCLCAICSFHRHGEEVVSLRGMNDAQKDEMVALRSQLAEAQAEVEHLRTDEAFCQAVDEMERVKKQLTASQQQLATAREALNK